MINNLDLNLNHSKFKYTVLLIALYVIAIPFQKILSFPIIEYRIQFTEIIFFLILTSFLLSVKLYDITKITQLHNRIDLGIIVWIGAVLVNVLIHQNYNSIIEFLGQSYLVCLYFIIRIAFFSFSENKIINILEILFKLLGIVIFLSILLGLLFYLFGIDIGVFWKFKDYPYFGTLFRLKALTNEPVMLASILNIIFLTQILTIFKFFKGDFNKDQIAFIAVVLIMLFFTFTKSMACLFAVLFFLLSKFSNKKYKRVIFISSSIVLIFCYIFMSHFILTKNDNRMGEGYGTEHPEMKVGSYFLYKTWYLVQKERAFELFKQSPVFGVGGGNMYTTLTKTENSIYPPYDPLSTYTGILAEFGIVGILAFCFLIFTISSEFIKLPERYPGKYIFFGAFICILLEAVCTDIMNFRHFWVVLSFFSCIVSYFQNTNYRQNIILGVSNN
jgi:hypothetical protein